MKNQLKCCLSICLCMAMLLSFAGCKKNNVNDDDSDYSIIYEYQTAKKSGENQDADIGDGTENTENGKKATKSNKSNKSKSKSSTSVVSGINVGGKTVKPYKDNSSRIKDLNGRKIVYVATWDATDRTSEAGRIISATERQLNCVFEERKMSSYKTLYTSILSGNPIADIFCPSDAPILNLAANNMLVPLDTLSNFDFSEDCWDQTACVDTKLNGHIYGMSRNVQWREILFYNKDMFAKNGWSDLYTLQEQGKLTWDVLEGIMKKAVSVSGSGVVNRYGLVPLYSLQEFGFSMLAANGVCSITRVGDTKNFTNNFTTKNATLNALNRLKSWTDTKGMIYDNSSAGWDSGRQVFYSGKAACALIDYNQAGQIASNANFNVGMCLFPHGPDTKDDMVIHNVTYTCIAKGTKNPNDVALFWDVLRDNSNETANVCDVSKLFTDKSCQSTIDKYISAVQKGKAKTDYGKSMNVALQIKNVIDGSATPAKAVATVSQTLAASIEEYWK